jgi:hypothetical protein
MRLIRCTGEIKRFRPLIVAFLILVTAGYLLSTSTYYNTWGTLYPASASRTNAGCQLCHDAGQNVLNGYGHAIQQQAGTSVAARIQAVAGLNSDSDPGSFTNLQEINANTQPGWTVGTNTVYDIATGATSSMAAPTSIGTLDPPAVPPPATPAIGVAPLALDFGAVTVANTQSRSTTISNTGSANLSVNSLTISGSSNFVLNSSTPATPFNVAAGANAVVQVNYTPSAAGNDSGQLTIASNDSNQASIVVSLSGSGTPPATVCSINVTPLSLNLGSVQMGQSATQPVNIGNTGTGACTVSGLSVTGAEFSLSPSTPATPFTIQPGSSTNVQVSYSPVNTGADSGSLQAGSSDPSKPTVTVSLSGTGVPAAVCTIAVSPASLAFGTVGAGLSATMSAQVQNTGSASCSVTGLNVTGSGFSLGSAAPSLPAAIAAGGSISVPVNFSPVSAGAAGGSLAIGSNDPGTPSLSVPLSGLGQVSNPGTCTLTLSAATLDFGSVAIGTPATRSVSLGNSGGADCSVISLNTSGAGFALGASAPTLPFPISPGGTVSVPVTYTAADASPDTGSLAIGSNDPAQPTANVAVTGTGVAAAACSIQVSPAALDFGAVPLGSTQTRTTTVTNAGNTNCTVSSLALSGSSELALSATVPAPPVTLIPGESLAVAVAYTPTDLGSDAGTLTVGSTDPGQPTVVVSLAGSGVATPTVCSVSVTPLSLDFGQVGVGSSATLSTTVTNNGTSPCSVNWQLSSATSTDFALSAGGAGAPAGVQPGGTVAISVAYAPTNTGGDSGSLQVSTNDSSQPVVAVSLTGSSAAAGGAVDLAIVRFNVTEQIALSTSPSSSSDSSERQRRDEDRARRGGTVSIRLVIENRSQSTQSSSATVVGVENGAEVYRQTETVSARGQGGRRSFQFPSYTPTAAGTITWTVVIDEGDGVTDTASATTEVTGTVAPSRADDGDATERNKRESDSRAEDRDEVDAHGDSSDHGE